MLRGLQVLIALALQLTLPFVCFPGMVHAEELDEVEIEVDEGDPPPTGTALPVQADAEPPGTTDRQALTVFYHQRGVANHRLGRYVRAIEDLRFALQNGPKGQTDDDWGSRWRIQNDLMAVLLAHGDRFSEIEFLLGTSQEYRETDPYYHQLSQLKLMNAYLGLGMLEQAEAARQAADAAIARARARADWPTRRFAAMSTRSRFLGIYQRANGNHAEAELQLHEGVQWSEKSLEERVRIHPVGHQGIRQAAISLAHAKRNLADVLSTRGKYGEGEIVARAGLRDTLALFGPRTTQTGQALATVAWARFQQGDIAGAEGYSRRALDAVVGSDTVPHSAFIAARRAALANALLVQGRWQDAIAVYEQRDEGLRSDPTRVRGPSRTVGWAYALHKTGQSESAARMAGALAAGQLKRLVVNRWYVAQLHGVQAMALGASGRTPGAIKMFRQSIPDLVRRDLDDGGVEDTGYWRAYWQQTILEGYLELLATTHAAGGAFGKVDLVSESFRIADLARSSLVQEAITATAARARIPDPALAGLARRDQDALGRAAALNRLLARLAAASGDQRLDKAIAQMRSEIERLRAVHAELQNEIRSRYPEYAELIDPQPARVGAVQKGLASGQAVIAVYLGQSQSYVWTIAAGGAEFRVVPIGREEVERDVRGLRRALDFGDGSPAQLRRYDLAGAYNFYRAFFEPDEALWKDARMLNVIPHGALGQLPFGLLLTSAPTGSGEAAYRDAPWLVRKVAIAQYPSATALVALRRAPRGKAQRQAFIGFGDPLFAAQADGQQGAVRTLLVRKGVDRTADPDREPDGTAAPTLSRAFSLLSALPETSVELRDIAAALKADPARDVFVNGQATEKNVKQAGLDNRRVVAFATHGIAPGEITGLDQPALVLSNPALTGDTDNDGFLTMEEVLALKLDADWVVLSACNTASADGRGSEAVSGLGRAFFYAGARSLLVSNWAVETTSARLLTTELFKRQAENPQLTRAEALRQSMLDLMGKKGPGGFSYAHPAFWAPFSLVGDGGR